MRPMAKEDFTPSQADVPNAEFSLIEMAPTSRYLEQCGDQLRVCVLPKSFVRRAIDIIATTFIGLRDQEVAAAVRWACALHVILLGVKNFQTRLASALDIDLRHKG